jgi:hypothetical protein
MRSWILTWVYACKFRKGAIDPDMEPDFVELVTMLRGDRKRA